MFEETMIYLITKYPFFGSIIRRCTIQLTDKVGTAGVGLTKSCDILLMISPKFLESLPNIEQRAGLLMHEVYHLILEHITRGKNLNQQLYNIAADIALNQYIPAHMLPNGALTPEQFKLERGKHSEWYYKALENHDQIKYVNTLTPGDNHDFWKDMEENGLSEQEVKEKIERLTVGAYMETKEKWGDTSVPQEIKDQLDIISKNAKFAWKDELRNLFGRKMSSEVEYSRKRVNRRYGLKAAGKVTKYKPKILIAIDCSGSVSEKQYQEVFTFIKPLLKDGQEARLIFFDTEVSKHVYDVQKLDMIPSRPLSGGTSFDCVMEYANEYRPDLTVTMTDGYSPISVNPNHRTLWLNFSGSSNSNLPGKEILITFPS